jgi:peptidoglycan/xylan/chitin deacetylase (PgdA/CDA1 family)
LSRKRITVLAYHRVVDYSSAGFDAYLPNVSANPVEFMAQMEYVQARYDVIDIGHLISWLKGDRELPARPLLITFDDGYRDNYEHAFPILRQRGMPVLMFITTDFIGRSRPFYWDQLARAFRHTRKSTVSIEGLGVFRWTDSKQRARAMHEIIRKLKLLPNQEKERFVGLILEALETNSHPAYGKSLAMDWDQIREMAANGVSIGGHTHTHPILTRIPLEQARDEIRTCMAMIETEIGQPASTFAYTNGLEADFNQEHERILEEIGVQVAFSLIPGPSSQEEVRVHPLAIRRIMIHHRDNMARFEAKLGGAARLARDWF